VRHCGFASMAAAGERDAARAHAKATSKRWRSISLFVALPLIGLGGANAVRLMREHEEHMRHHPSVPVDYPYLRIRRKGFPWGDGSKTLFHNPAVNQAKLP